MNRKPLLPATGTEVGGAFLTASLLQPQAPSTFSTPALGANLALMDAGGNVSPHSSGEPFTGWVHAAGVPRTVRSVYT